MSTGSAKSTRVEYRIAAADAKIGPPVEHGLLDLAHEDAAAIVVPGVGHFNATTALAGGWCEAIGGAVAAGTPLFGICLGHQMLALALGAKTRKMNHGHHGANHPVKDLTTGKVEITSMNHGFTVDSQTLPKGVSETHVSLFDGSNCGIALEGRPVYSVQYHPEASPGPQDSFYLFERFAAAIWAGMYATFRVPPSTTMSARSRCRTWARPRARPRRTAPSWWWTSCATTSSTATCRTR